MKITFLLAATLTLLAGSRSLAQTNQPLSDTKPALSNITGQQYPKIDSQARATFRITASGAQKVQVSIGKTYDMAKGDNGVWSVTTEPLEFGFHYYSLVIDGVTVDDPASEIFFWRRQNEQRH